MAWKQLEGGCAPNRGRRQCAIAFAVAAVCMLLGACQRQEFLAIEPSAFQVTNHVIEVQARQLPPNIMLVVDRSGSMVASASGSGANCTIDGTQDSPYDPRSPNPCKWNDLKEALADPASGFLVRSQNLGRFGLLAFPGEDSETCGEGRTLVPIGESVQPIRFQLMNQLFPVGGTPTAQALLEAAKDPLLAQSEPNRKRFAMLLTDGLPNCSQSARSRERCEACDANPAACVAPTGCRPTFGPADACPPNPFSGAACLDDEGLVSAVESLRAQGIESFVIGFGQATSGGDAAALLNAAAEAGGHAREGAPERYYQADSVEELSGFLGQILQAFPCTYSLEPPPADGRFLSVELLDRARPGAPAQPLSRELDWIFEGEGFEKLKLVGDACDLVQTAPDDRYSLRISYAALVQ